jgi:hypothetical protein
MLSNLKIDLKYFIGLLFVIAGLCIVLTIQVREGIQKENIISEQKAEIEYYNNRIGTETAKRFAVEVNKNKLKEYYEKEISTIRERHNIKTKNLEAAVLAKVETVVRDTIKVSVKAKGDTPNLSFSSVDWKQAEIDFNNSDKWHRIRGNISNGVLKYDIATFDSLSFVFHRKRTGFLGMGRKQIIIEGASDNPYTKIEGIKGIKVGNERRRPFGIGVSFGYGMTDQGLSPYVGIGLTYQLIRL